MAVINTNVKALFSQMALKTSGLEQSKAMQQLSTGKRINSARDDAAGMSIATRMTHQIRSLNQAVRNAGDAINLIQTAEGATNEITDMMQRMRELAVQAVNDTNANADRSYLDLEFQQLKQQIVQIADNTEWNGFPVLSGKAGEQVGEMPVYKTTSQNQFSDIFISPTTSRTVTGTNGSTAVNSTETYDTTTSTSPYLISGSVKIDVDALGTIKATFKTPEANADPITLNATKVMSGGTWTGEIKLQKSDSMNSGVLAKDVTYKFTTSAGATVANPINSSLQVDVNGGIPTLHNGDLTINGIVIGPSSAADDHVSPLNNAAGSAIAKAAAINAKAVDQGVSQGEIQAITFSGTPSFGNSATADITVAGVQIHLTSAMDTPVLVAKSVAAQLQADPNFTNSGNTVSWSTGSPTVIINYPTSSGDVDKVQVTGTDELGFQSVTNTTQQYQAVQPGTGVFAKVNENVFSGQAMSGLSVVTGRVYVNGYASADIQSVMNNPQATRANVVRAINLISDKTGVKALDSGSDDKGVTLVAVDGRNIEVQFQTTGTTASNTDFGQRLGLREGVQSATISLESKISSPSVLGSITGDISNVGFDAGNYSKNEATVNTHARALGTAAVAQVTSFKLSGSSAPAVGDTVSVVVNGTTYKHTVAATTETIKTAYDDIYGQLTTAATAPKNVLVSRGSTNEILITATEPGVPFSASSANTGTAFSAVTTEKVANAKAGVVDLSMNDLMINGVTIRASDANDDTLSDVTVSSSDRASSAIALAAAINDSTAVTGVRAVPNPVVLTGTNTSVDNPPTGPQDLWINGHKVTVTFNTADDVATRCKNVAEAINKNLEGITAVSTDTGVTVTAADGRNVSAWFDSTVQGLSAASFGLDMGGAAKQVSTITPTSATTAAAISFRLNGQLITTATPASTSAADVGLAIANAIGLAKQASNSTFGNLDVAVNASGVVTITSSVAGSSFDLRGADTGTTGVGLTFATTTANDPGKNIVTGVNLSDNYKQYVLGGTQTYPNVKTAYGTVKLIAAAPNLPGLPDADGLTSSLMNLNGQPIRIQTGADGFNDQSNFNDLGFYEGVFGGRASVDMDPPRVGRLAFQVGSSANQTITIDLADFGKNGPITAGITGDVDQKLENRTVRINTRDGASQVLNLLDVAMDKINATRSTMGAVMNRLDHVINNLTNVSMNMSASRSTIEDADYASASTELAKTQIMQQAATAVLAQANTSQQSVLKLLGG